MTLIYTLSAPDREVRYVGKTVKSLGTRLARASTYLFKMFVRTQATAN